MTVRRGLIIALILTTSSCRSRAYHGAGVSPARLARPPAKAAPVSAARPRRAPEARSESPGVSLDLVGTPLRDAVGLLRSHSGLNIVISPLIYEERAPGELRVTLKLNDVSVKVALDWITRLLRLQWYADGGIIYITVPGDPPRRRPTNIYSVHDLTAPAVGL